MEEFYESNMLLLFFLQSCLYKKNIKTESLQIIVSFTKIYLGPLHMVACDPKCSFKP